MPQRGFREDRADDIIRGVRVYVNPPGYVECAILRRQRLSIRLFAERESEAGRKRYAPLPCVVPHHNDTPPIP